MNRLSNRLVIRVVQTTLCIALWAAAAHSDNSTEAVPNHTNWGRLLMLPFYNMTAIYGEDASLRGPLSKQVYVTDVVSPDADRLMNQLLERQLARRTGIEWFTAYPGNGLAVLNLSEREDDHLAQLVDLGIIRGAKHVMSGYLYAFRPREGGDYGAQTPAKVVFELVVIRISSGRIVWQRRFDETQQALSENLLNIGKFIRRKGRWINAEEMAEYAIGDMLDRLLAAPPPPE